MLLKLVSAYVSEWGPPPVLLASAPMLMLIMLASPESRAELLIKQKLLTRQSFIHISEKGWLD